MKTKIVVKKLIKNNGFSGAFYIKDIKNRVPSWVSSKVVAKEFVSIKSAESFISKNHLIECEPATIEIA